MNAPIRTPVFPMVAQASAHPHGSEGHVPTARQAEIHLNDWILASPVTRSCWGLTWGGGKWRIGLSVSVDGDRFERLPAAQHEDYAQCVINAIEIARLAGYG